MGHNDEKGHKIATWFLSVSVDKQINSEVYQLNYSIFLAICFCKSLIIHNF